MSTVRKIPMRKCVGCNEKREKKELIRVLKTPEETIILDATGRLNGRGAYLCRNTDCFRKAVRSKGLERSLGVSIPSEVLETLEKEMGEIEQK